MSKRKLLVETSAVRAKVGPTTEAHEQAFDNATVHSSLYTSTYIRMEFIRRWICSMIDMAVVVSRYGDVTSALTYLEQSFSIRDVKSYTACVAQFLKANGCLSNSDAAAEELARTAFHWMRRFGKLFPGRIQNRSRCKRGGNVLRIGSFATIIEDTARFHSSFKSPITNCEVGSFLKLNSIHSESKKVLENIDDKQVQSLAHVRKYAQDQTHLTCKECERIGDFVIALEQTRMYSLVHVDSAFSFLCHARSMPNIPIPSLRGSERKDGAS